MTEKFTIVRRGYDTAEVDMYIENLETVIKNYKEKDAAINNALISAQVTAGNIIKEAEGTAGAMKAGAVSKLDAITSSLATQKLMVKDFQDSYNALVRKYLHEVNETELLSLYAKVQDLEEYIDGLASDGTAGEAAAGEPVPAEAPSPSSWL